MSECFLFIIVLVGVTLLWVILKAQNETFSNQNHHYHCFAPPSPPHPVLYNAGGRKQRSAEPMPEAMCHLPSEL